MGCAASDHPMGNRGTEGRLPATPDPRGETLGALALTEPNAGTDERRQWRPHYRYPGSDGDAGSSTVAKPDHRPQCAPVIVTLCRTDKEAGARGSSMILVEAGAEGMDIVRQRRKSACAGRQLHRLFTRIAGCHRRDLLGEEGRGFHQTMETLDGGRIGIGALSVGLAQGAFEPAVRYAKQREAFGQKIAAFQAIQFMIADAALEIDAARLLVQRAAWLKDQGKPFTKAAAMAKLHASEVAERVCHNAIQIHGSYGYSQEFPVERIYRDQRLMTIGEGTSQIVRTVIARRVLEEMQ